ncbi:carbohydrate ABC transporter membrane protein 2 (CUT1 family) [Stella humosa]|uniref:sn-glycerol-3-phosphate transport system permease protein UgpE n=1 Tax=Stella humosa TaxID=94 RepID=A0A3N1KTI9_9PROT|nr:ABC transporter permease subunit [Stella humosa]ROP81426.1 carbohydrate ABC transporter membrane protein 2 (CUT1 family) [Stella humosa]BBK32778.1 sn-glycerol-3-phosphate transport system permease protein UgpE [Stella humosa]
MIERHPVLDLACHAVLVLGAAIVCMPIYFAFVAGSLTIQEVQQVPLPWLPGSHFVANAETAWNKGNFARLFINSAIVAVGITVGKIAVSMLSAFALAYFRFRWRMTAFWLIFASLMLPVEVRIVPTFESVANAALPLQWVVDELDLAGWWEVLTGNRIEIALQWNLINTYSGLILPLIASATATFLFRQFFLTIPDELCEAARIDGASPWRFFRSILLPLSTSNMVALAIILFLHGWNQYLWPLLFTTDKNMATAVIGLKHLIPRSDMEPAWNIAMNAALITMLPPVVVVVALQRWLVKGLVDSSK